METGSRDGKRPGLLQRRRAATLPAEEDGDIGPGDSDSSDEQAETGGQDVRADDGRQQGNNALPTGSIAQQTVAKPSPRGPKPETAGEAAQAAAEQPAAKRRRVLGAADVKSAAAAAKLELGLTGVFAFFRPSYHSYRHRARFAGCVVTHSRVVVAHLRCVSQSHKRRSRCRRITWRPSTAVRRGLCMWRDRRRSQRLGRACPSLAWSRR